MPRYYKTIRELQPDCAMRAWIDVRWAETNEVLRKCEWSVVPAYLGFDEFGEKRNSASKGFVFNDLIWVHARQSKRKSILLASA